MALRRSLALLSALTALLVLAPTNAVGSAAAKTYRFRVVAVTHTSSSQKSDPPFYTGSSTSTWHLSRVRTISVTVVGGFITGGGYLNVKGVYTAEASTNFGGRPNHCQLSAPTGSQDYPAVAPGRFPLSIGPSSTSPRRASIAIGPGGDIYASLSNPYFGTECSTSVSGEPDANRTHVTSVPKSIFTHRLVTLRLAGSTSKEGITYHWSTTVKLKRIVRR